MPTCHDHDQDHARLLRSAKLRVTAPRLAVLDVLCHVTRPLDAQGVLDALERTPTSAGAHANKPRAADGLDRVTVYRTLTTLAKSGIAHRIDAGDRVFRYALAAGGSHHAHTPDPLQTPGDQLLTPRHNPAQRIALKALAIAEHVHPHFVCDTCGIVECVNAFDSVLKPVRTPKPARATKSAHAPRPARSAQAATAPLASAAGFYKDRKITRHEVLLHGTCRACQANESRASISPVARASRP